MYYWLVLARALYSFGKVLGHYNNLIGRKFCHITPCHESLAIDVPNKMRLPIKRTFNDVFALKKKKKKKKKIKVGHSGCMLKSVMLPLASIGTWGWGWKNTKGNREKILRHKNYLAVLSYSHVILAKPCTFPTYTVTNVIKRSNIEVKQGFLCTNICQVPIFPISDILFIKPEISWNGTLLLSHCLIS